MKLSNKAYDKLKIVCEKVFPALIACLSAILALMDVDAETIAAIAGIGSALNVCLGTILGMSTKQYNDELDRYIDIGEEDEDEDVCCAPNDGLTVTAEDIIAIAKEEVGYCEKASNKSLDDKTANAGKKNWTKYARDLRLAGYYNGDKNGYNWCAVFMDWIFFKATGYKAEAAKYKPQGSLGASSTKTKGYYQKIGRLFTTPMPGDQVFIKVDGSVGHTGLVTKVENNKVYTIEGNCGDKVAEKSYKLNSSVLDSYGRPYYAEPAPAPVEDELKVGDIVMLNAEAKVYGKTYGFKSWVYSRKLYVRAIKGDKVTVSTLKVGAVTGSTYRNMVVKIK